MENESNFDRKTRIEVEALGEQIRTIEIEEKDEAELSRIYEQEIALSEYCKEKYAK